MPGTNAPHSVVRRARALVVGLIAVVSIIGTVGMVEPAAAADCLPAEIVHGAIGVKYWDMGGPSSPLRCPMSYEIANPNGRGIRQHFAGGTIYWSHDSGAHPVWGAISWYWGTQNWEQGIYGLPTSDELVGWGGNTRYQYFQCGVITWDANTGNVWGDTCR